MASGMIGKLSIGLSANAAELVSGLEAGERSLSRFAKRVKLTEHQSSYVAGLKQQLAIQKQWENQFATGERARRSGAWLANEQKVLAEQRDLLAEIEATGKTFAADAQSAIAGGPLGQLDALFGRGSKFTGWMRTISGSGAFIGLSIASRQVAELGAAMRSAAEAMHAGQKNWQDLVLDFTHSLPIIGGVVKGLSDLAAGLAYAIGGEKSPEMLIAEDVERAAAGEGLARSVETRRRSIAMLKGENDAARQRLGIEEDYRKQLRELDVASGGGWENFALYRRGQEMIEEEKLIKLRRQDETEAEAAYAKLNEAYERGKDVRLETLQLEKQWRQEAVELEAEAARKRQADADKEFARLDAIYERQKEAQLEGLRAEDRWRNERIDAQQRELAIAKEIAKLSVQRRAASIREQVQTPAERFERELRAAKELYRAGRITWGELVKYEDKLRAEAGMPSQKLIDLRNKMAIGMVGLREFLSAVGLKWSAGPGAVRGSPEAWRHERGMQVDLARAAYNQDRQRNGLLGAILRALKGETTAVMDMP